MEKVYDLFSGLYASKGSHDTFLAFEMGVPFSKDMFTLNGVTSPAVAIESQSAIVNAVLTVQGEYVQRTTRTVDGQVGFMLVASMPVDAASMATLGAVKGPANEAFKVDAGSLQGEFRYHPVYASPANWYDPNAKDNWIQHTVGQQQGPQAPATSLPPSMPPRRVMIEAPRWHVLPEPMRPVLAHPVAASPHEVFRPQTFVVAHPTVQPITHPAVQTIAHPIAHPEFAMIRRPAAALVNPHPSPVVAPHPPVTIAPKTPGPTVKVAPTVKVEPSAKVPTAPVPTVNPMVMAQLNAQLHATTTSQAVAANSVTISFEHCIVSLIRPWFPEQFLMVKNWYVPGYSSASFSNGTGIGDSGLLPVLTSGFVAIRNLSISSKWSAQDLAVAQGSAAFGPFSLVGRTYDANSGTLSCPGMQIIGWFCTALPTLPPLTDPAIVPAASTATTSGNAPATGATGPPSSATPAAPPATTAGGSAPAAAATGSSSIATPLQTPTAPASASAPSTAAATETPPAATPAAPPTTTSVSSPANATAKSSSGTPTTPTPVAAGDQGGATPAAPTSAGTPTAAAEPASTSSANPASAADKAGTT
jgi:hypothetical protein